MISTFQFIYFIKNKYKCSSFHYFQITLNLWKDKALNFNNEKYSILSIKRCKITEYQQIKKLTITNSSIIKNDYDGPDKEMQVYQYLYIMFKIYQKIIIIFYLIRYEALIKKYLEDDDILHQDGEVITN